MMLRRLAIPLLGALCLTAALFPGVGRAQMPIGGFSSENVEWIKNVPVEFSTRTQTRGNLVGDYFYTQSFETLEIYDVSDPLNPRLTSQIRRPGPTGWPQQVGWPPLVPNSVPERTATNGKILLWPGGNEDEPTGLEGAVYVYDIRDKADPKLISVADMPGVYSSGLVCLFDCKWAYTRGGYIVDLRDPHKPRVVKARWNEDLEFDNNVRGYPNAILNEIKPGFVLTGSVPIYLLDVSPDPRKPRVLGTSDGSPMSFGPIAWPGFPKQTLIMSTQNAAEFMPPRCEIRDAYRGSTLDSGFKTWTAARWKTTGFFRGVDVYRVKNGTYTDGDPAFSGAIPPYWGCGANLFDVHPDFRNGGIVAQATYGHGVKFLRIDPRGKIEPVGWFLPHANDTFAAYWITNEIVYTLDVPRGIDILSFTGKT